MLTIKQILDNKEAVIRGLEKKHFADARETIEQVLALDNKRKEAQAQLDILLSQVKTISKSIGGMMKEGKKEEAEAAKEQVAEIKEQTKELEESMKTNVLKFFIQSQTSLMMKYLREKMRLII